MKLNNVDDNSDMNLKSGENITNWLFQFFPHHLSIKILYIKYIYFIIGQCPSVVFIRTKFIYLVFAQVTIAYYACIVFLYAHVRLYISSLNLLLIHSLVDSFIHVRTQLTFHALIYFRILCLNWMKEKMKKFA